MKLQIAYIHRTIAPWFVTIFVITSMQLSVFAEPRQILTAETVNPKSFVGMPFAQLSQVEVDRYFNSPNELRFLIPVPFDPFGEAAKLGIANAPKTIYLEVRVLPIGAVEGKLPKGWKESSQFIQSMVEGRQDLWIYGGPGRSTSGTIPYEWSPEKSDGVQLANLNKISTIFVVAQPFSPEGLSAPLDMSNPSQINMEMVSHFANEEVFAYYQYLATKWLVAKGYMNPRKTNLWGFSYGANIAQAWAKLRNSGKIDIDLRSMILASGTILGYDAVEQLRGALPAIQTYNEKIETWSAGQSQLYSTLITEVRDLLSAQGFDPNIVHSFFGPSIISSDQRMSIYGNLSSLRLSLKYRPSSVVQLYNLREANPLIQLLSGPDWGYLPMADVLKQLGPLPQKWMLSVFDGISWQQRNNNDRLRVLFRDLKERMPPLSLKELAKFSHHTPVVIQASNQDTVGMGIYNMLKIVRTLKLLGGNVSAVETVGAHRSVYGDEAIYAVDRGALHAGAQ